MVESLRKELMDYVLRQDNCISGHLATIIDYIRDKTPFSFLFDQAKNLPQSTNGTKMNKVYIERLVSELSDEEVQVVRNYLDVACKYLGKQTDFSEVDKTLDFIVDLNPKTPKLSPPGQEFYSGRRPLIELYRGL